MSDIPHNEWRQLITQAEPMTAPTPEASPATKLSPSSESAPDGLESTTPDARINLCVVCGAGPEWAGEISYMGYGVTVVPTHIRLCDTHWDAVWHAIAPLVAASDFIQDERGIYREVYPDQREVNK